ncbi:hypothetical protein [Vibrio agarivorans]|uniref:hypothetical protein n=1 Tax=Vibrio agarivorans TaxID=153622 RepID=UPI00223194B3|nr:hypothetical protein [Vibrio agarivorans]MDN3663460.1 hypothetical protein [Vibrio agarivorans]
MKDAHTHTQEHEVVHEWIRESREKERHEARLEAEKRKNTKLTALENFLRDWKKKPNPELLK